MASSSFSAKKMQSMLSRYGLAVSCLLSRVSTPPFRNLLPSFPPLKQILNAINLYGKPIRVSKSSTNKHVADVGANLFVSGLVGARHGQDAVSFSPLT